MTLYSSLGGCNLTSPANQYNEKKAAAAATAENGFSGAALKAEPGKSVPAANNNQENFKARAVAMAWVDAAAACGMQLIHGESQRQALINEAMLPAGRHRLVVERLTKRMFTTGRRPSSNRQDWSQALSSLNDQVDKAVQDGEGPADDKRERWYLTDQSLDVTRALMTYSRQEAADRQKQGWSVVGVDVDDELYRDEETGEWFRKYLDGTCRRIEIGGLSYWEKELNLKPRTDVFA